MLLSIKKIKLMKNLNSIISNSFSKEKSRNNLTSEEIENKRRKIEKLKYDLRQLDLKALILDNEQ